MKLSGINRLKCIPRNITDSVRVVAAQRRYRYGYAKEHADMCSTAETHCSANDASFVQVLGEHVSGAVL